MKHLTCVLPIAALLLICSNGFAQSLPQTMSYQGILNGGGGSPVADGSYQFVFSIYDGTGTKVWTESQALTTTRGLYQAVLGKSSALPVPFPRDAELEVSVNGTVLSPRSKLTGVPWALDLAKNFVGA